MWQIIKQTTKSLLVCFIILAMFLSGFPSKDFFSYAKDFIKDRNVIDSLYLALQDNNVIDRQAKIMLNSPVPKVSAATFQMQTGYFVGNGGVQSITGLGFRPEMIVLKSNTNTIATIFHTDVMPDNVSAYMGTLTADSTAGFIRMNDDGFTVYSTANTSQIRYTYIAFTGSDCSASGTMCIGSYVGTGGGSQAINSVGFQPDLVWTKIVSSVSAATWRSSAMPVNYGQFFSAAAENTGGNLFQTLDANGFTVGSANNQANIYHYVAFKEVSGFMDVGTYTGNATDNRNITGVGFKPDWLFLKNANAATAVSAVHSVPESYGDSSSYFTNTANLVDSIQLLQTNGFQVGANSTSNGSGNTIYYSAFKGNSAPSASGTFKMASGTYTANGTIQIIEGLDFKPDLVIIKGETTQNGVFRTSLMPQNITAHLGAATANFAGGITALNHDGFTIGENATVNTNGVTYHWQAFGNAWSPTRKSGAADFAIGAYYGNTIDNRNITGLPFQPDMLVVKLNGASAGMFRTSAHTGDTTSFFTATANTANHIQGFNSEGFQVGNVTTVVNTAGSLYWWFAFKEGTDFDVGTYTGNGADNRDITAPGFNPDLVWIKRSTAVAGVTRPSTLAGDLTQYFITTAQAAGRIKSFVANGFRLGTQAEVNTNAGVYFYAAWDNNSTQSSVSPAPYSMKTGYYVGDGAYQEITGLGFRPEMIILKANTNAGHGTIYKTEHMAESGVNGLTTNSSAAVLAETATYDIVLKDDGFQVIGANSNTVNAGYTWMAFAGSDCSASGTMCIGSYVGNASNPRTITTGFQPTYVSAGERGNVHYFTTSAALTTEGAGGFTYLSGVYTASANFISAINPTNFQVGTSLNTSPRVYYYFSFKDGTNIQTSSYVGDGTASRDVSTSFQPDALFLRGDDASASGLFNTKFSFGNNTNFFGDLANSVGTILGIIGTGFRISSLASVNTNASQYYFIAFEETSIPTAPSGSFTMETGTYTGNGAYQRIEGLSGQPDLLIIKGETAQNAVYRTKAMPVNSTAYVGASTANLGGAITSLNHDGFNVGNSATVNTNGIVYHYQAFYNAYDGLDHSGSEDFTLGSYVGNGVDNRNIDTLPFQPDMVWLKRSGASAGAFRTSAHTGDNASFFINTADTSNLIQSFETNGFQIGTNASSNTAANIFWYVAFKESGKFKVGKYTGDGLDDRDITSPGHTPDLVWVKRDSNVLGLLRPATLSGDNTFYFSATAQVAGRIKSIIANGFRIGTQAEVNTNAVGYYFASWSTTGAVSSSLNQSAYRFFENTNSTDVGLALNVQDTPASLTNAGESFRLRLLVAVDTANMSLSGEDFKLQFVDKGSGTCEAPSAGTPATYTDVTDSTAIAFRNNAGPADEDALDANANDPTDGARTIINQSYQELNNFTNNESLIADGQTGKWDFSLFDNGADPETTFCFRAVRSNGTALDTYTEYPEITTSAGSQSLTFSISDNSIGFGSLTPSFARYATGDSLGSTSDSTAPTVISVMSSANGGYSLTVGGSTLICISCGGSTIEAIGATPAPSTPGTSQFGIRVGLLFGDGTGTVSAPYDSSNWAFDEGNMPDQIGYGSGDGSETLFGVRYMANTTSVSDAGEYGSTLTYTVTATY